MEKPVQTYFARFWPWALGVGALLAVLGAKFKLINFFGSDIPWGDQWHGEVLTSYLPYLEGTFDWHKWFAPHFEHRILWTRLLDIGLLELNGRWDPRLQIVTDTLIVLTAVAVLVRQVLRDLPPLSAAAAVGFIAIFFGSEALWENTLWGFQSQFYFFLLFSLVHVLQTSSARPWSAAWWIGHAAGLANLFSMAGGAMSAAALLGWLAWRRWRSGERAPGDGFTAGWNGALLVFSVLLLPSEGIFVHGSTRPPLWDLIHRFCDVLSWPVLDWKFGLLVWAPALLFLFNRVVAPRTKAGPPWLLPLVLLILLFCATVAYARGGALASRYSDFYATGVFANLICLLAWPATGRAAKLKLIVLWLWSSLVIHCLWRDEQYAYVYTLQQDTALRQREAERIRHYLRTGDSQFIRSDVLFDSHQISVLEIIRQKPALQGILPLSLQNPPPMVPAGDQANHGFTADQLPVLPGLPAGFTALGSQGAAGAEAQWTSAPLTARQPFLVFYVAGEIKPPLTALTLLTADGRTIRPLKNEVRAEDKWVRLNFANPGGPFQIVARDASPSAGFAFSGPLQYGRLSWLVPKVLYGWNALLTGGWLLLAGAALVPLLAWLRADD